MVRTKKSQIRSPKENKYYWAVVAKSIAHENLVTSMEAHEWIKTTFGVESTATLTTIEFEELMGKVRRHCLKYWDLEIPLPNED